MTQDEKSMGVLVHLASFAGYLIPLGSVLGPLTVWLMKRDEYESIERGGRKCINFKISFLIYMAVTAILMVIFVRNASFEEILIQLGVGFAVLGLLTLIDILCTIMAAIKASEGKEFNYPLSIRFIKPRALSGY